ncbi:MAG: glycosyltransferase family 9 protein [Candidatus Omnitrophica bacterium]|nr:glycosyltransferase family 9 protein [Candidatus Omnitrophota bacterium]
MARQAVSLTDVFRSIAPFRLKLFKAFDHLGGQALAFVLPKQPHRTFNGAAKKILIIRPGGIGDAVFLLPILKALKGRGLVMDILCESRNAQVFTSQAHLLNRIYLYDKGFFGVFANTYDAVIDTEQWHFLSAIAGYFIKTGYRTGFATRVLRAKLFNGQVDYGENDYELSNFQKLFNSFYDGDKVNDINNCFEVPEPMKEWAQKQIQGNYVTLFLGGSIALRRLNEEQVLDLVDHYLKNNFSIAFLGGKDVEDFAQKMTVRIDSRRIFNYAGRLSLMQSAALIQQARKFIGPDSGLMHLACAVGTPVAAIFGPGNLAKWGPRGSRHKVITLDVPCAPCTRFGYTLPTCNGSYHCVRNINIAKMAGL